MTDHHQPYQSGDKKARNQLSGSGLPGLNRDGDDYNRPALLYNILEKRYARHRLASAGYAFLAAISAGLLLFALLSWFEAALYLDPRIKSAGLLFSLAAAVGTFLLVWRKPPSFEHYLDHFCKDRNLQGLRDGLDLWLHPDRRASASDGPGIPVPDSPRQRENMADLPGGETTEGDGKRVEHDHQFGNFHEYAIRRNLDPVTPDQLRKALTQYHRYHPRRDIDQRTISWSMPLLLIAGLLVVAHTDAAERTLTFWQPFEPPNPWTYELMPEPDTTFLHGDSFRPVINFTDEGRRELPDRVVLATRQPGSDEWSYRAMTPADGQTFEADEQELTAGIEWRVEMDRFSSPTYQADVHLPPSLEELTVETTPPSYTGLDPDERTYPFARIQAITGSEITVRGRPSVEPADLHLALELEDDTLRVPMEPDNESGKWIARFTIDGHERASVYLEDEKGYSSRAPYRFSFEEIIDEPPVVRILDPRGTITLSEAMDIELLFEADDDFGLSGAELVWEHQRAFTDQVTEESERLPTPARGEPQLATWTAGDLNLRPRDQVRIRIRVQDNDPVHGPKTAESRAITLQLASMADRLERVNEREAEADRQLEGIDDRYRDLEQSYEQLREQLRQNPVPGEEEQQMGEDLAERHRDVEEQIRELDQQFRELQQEINSNDRMSDETRRAYDELRQLFEELDDPDFRDALEELRRTMQEFTAAELEEAMQNYEFNEQLYRERIERTIELFHTLRMNSDLDRLAAQYDDLGERLQELSGGEISPEDLEYEQRMVREESESLGERIDQLEQHSGRRGADRLEQLRQESREELEQLHERLDQLIQEAESESEEGQPGDQAGDARSGDRDDIAQTYLDRAESIRQAKQQMGGQQIQVNLLALQRAFYRVVELSEEQERLFDRSEAISDGSPEFVELARRQRVIRDHFSMVADTLQGVSREIPALTEQINRRRAQIGNTITRSVDLLAEREQSPSTLSARQSMAGLNELASMLAGVIDQLKRQQDGQAGGMSMDQMMEQMEELSGQQQEMNQQLQDLINDIQGERLTVEESDRLEQLAAQQNELRRQLQEIQQSGSFRSGDRTLSDLERIAEEMEESIREMRGGRTDPLMSERQQNILTRMLDATEAMQEQGESDEVEGETAMEVDAPRPEDGYSPDMIEEELRSRLQDPELSRFREEYQDLIQRYLDRLRELDNEIN